MQERRSETEDRELLMERVFAAPRATVWRAFTQPEHLAHWWGPNGFRTTYHEYDLRPGGTAKYTMHGPDGRDWPNKVWFLEVDAPARLVYDHGDFERPWFHVTVVFEQRDDRTLLRMRTLFATAAECEQAKTYAVEGGRQTLERLAHYLEKMS